MLNLKLATMNQNTIHHNGERILPLLKNKIVCALMLFCFFSTDVSAQKTVVDWGEAISYTGFAFFNTSAIDKLGNVYYLGSFYGTNDFDPGPGIHNESSTSSVSNSFIVKLDNQGKFKWVRIIRGGYNEARDISFDSENNLVVVGDFRSTIDLNPLSESFNITSALPNVSDGYVVKLSSFGLFIWGDQIKGIKEKGLRKVNIDTSDNIYFGGYFAGSVDFDPGAGEVLVMNDGGADAFLCKLDKEGHFLFVKNFFSSGTNIMLGIEFDQQGNTLCTGTFYGKIDLDPGPLNDFHEVSGDDTHPFLLKLDASGNYIWGKHFEGTGFFDPQNLFSSPDNDIILTGTFSDKIDANPSTGTVKHNSHGKVDVFVIKLNSTGKLIWSLTYGGPKADAAYEAAIDKFGDIYLTGYFSDKVDFDPSTNVYELQTYGIVGDNAYILKLDRNGKFLWVKHIGSPGVAIGQQIAVDQNLSIYCTGEFAPQVDLNVGGAPITVTGTAENDDYVAKIDQLYGTQNITTCHAYTWIDGKTYTESISPANYYFKTTSGQDTMVVLNLTFVNPDLSVTLDDNKLTASASGVNYQWLDCNDGYNPISGATQQTFNPTYNSSYAVEISSNECRDTSECFDVNVLSLNNDEQSINIYPNPTTGKIIINGINNIKMARITDVFGRSKFIKLINNEIDLANQISGFYFVEIQDGSTNKYFYKVMKL